MTTKIVFGINNRNVTINKNIVDKYNDIVCPITEKIMAYFIDVFGDNCDDETLSLKIESDMEQEIKEYGL